MSSFFSGMVWGFAKTAPTLFEPHNVNAKLAPFDIETRLCKHILAMLTDRSNNNTTEAQETNLC